MIWHYAVHVGGYYYQPCCVGHRLNLDGALVDHGITIVRGDVTCPDCKRAMGMV